jgi:hypothetical protein
MKVRAEVQVYTDKGAEDTGTLYLEDSEPLNVKGQSLAAVTIVRPFGNGLTYTFVTLDELERAVTILRLEHPRG